MSSAIIRPRLIVVVGPNGAGKTSITEQLLRYEWMGGCALEISPQIDPASLSKDGIASD